jgi:hypothetical protein
LIVAGLDPGSAHLALAVLSVQEGLPPEKLCTQTLEVGHKELLAKPKVRKSRGGNTVTQTERRVVSWDDVLPVCVRVAELLSYYSVQLTAVEVVEHGHIMQGVSAAVAGGILTAIAQSQLVAGALLMTLSASLGAQNVRTVSHRSWTARLGIGTTTGRRGTVAEVVEAAIPSLGRTNEHVRDACGCALWLVTPSKEEAEKAKRAAAGCLCPGRHRKGCALYGARKA